MTVVLEKFLFIKELEKNISRFPLFDNKKLKTGGMAPENSALPP